MIRTTISLPEDFHEELRLMALKNRTTLGELVVNKFRGKQISGRFRKKETVDEEVEKMFAFFDSVAKEGEQIDAVKAVREERDRDNA